MDHLIFDSERYEEYLLNVREMRQRLETELQTLSDERRRILRQNDTQEDQVLQEVMIRINRTIRRLDAVVERLTRLGDAISDSIDIFVSAERRLQNTEMDLLYRGAVAGARNQAAGPQYVIFPGAITGSSLVTEPWLRDLADDAG